MKFPTPITGGHLRPRKGERERHHRRYDHRQRKRNPEHRQQNSCTERIPEHSPLLLRQRRRHKTPDKVKRKRQREKHIHAQTHFQPDEKRFQQCEIVQGKSFRCRIRKQPVHQKLRRKPRREKQKQKHSSRFQQNKAELFQMFKKTLVLSGVHCGFSPVPLLSRCFFRWSRFVPFFSPPRSSSLPTR